MLDVGGNIGEFAEQARDTWHDARITSFEPLPGAANANRERARGRWWVEQVAVSSHTGVETIHFCVNQHTVSSLHPVGPVRRERFGYQDRFEDASVAVDTLDRLVHPDPALPRRLLKIDVEGHELEVLRGAARVLGEVAVCVIEVNQAPVFLRAPPPAVVDDELRQHGLYFAGVVGVQLDPRGEVVQFDGVWSR